MIPSDLKDEVESALGLRFLNSRKLDGGSISNVVLAKTSSVDIVLKWNLPDEFMMLATEEMGLRLLSKANSGLKIPEVYTIARSFNHSWIAMEYIPEGSGGKQADRNFGAGLARLHRNTSTAFGLDHDNFIGRLPQSNKKDSSWLSFFMNQRIKPQLKQAVSAGLIDKTWVEKLPQLEKTAASLFPEEPPALLHGDLWSGNWLYSQNNNAAIIDPAVYYGNREIEIAFTSLFGSFPAGFYEAYNQEWPLEPGFDERRALYNLYPVLVHVNLFGRSYSGQAESILKSYT